MARGPTRKAKGTSPTDGPKKRGRPRKTPPSVAAQAMAGTVPDATYKLHLEKIGALRGDMKRAQDALNAARGSYRAALKVAKQDGCNPDAIAAAFAERDKDQVERKMYFRDFGRALRLLGVPLGTQLNLFDGDATVAAIEGDGPTTPEMAEQRGRIDCKAGVPNDANPFEPGTEQHQRWRIGWDLHAEGVYTAKNAPARGIGQSAVVGNA
jgi:hypothetical protein